MATEVKKARRVNEEHGLSIINTHWPWAVEKDPRSNEDGHGDVYYELGDPDGVVFATLVFSKDGGGTGDPKLSGWATAKSSPEDTDGSWSGGPYSDTELRDEVAELAYTCRTDRAKAEYDRSVEAADEIRDAAIKEAKAERQKDLATDWDEDDEDEFTTAPDEDDD